ncbi:MAG: FHIPEP family type III secretion protein [Myxococcales bacterium]|nr:FHIPEP family type III secretion protein [Myxococcales bacterium]
MDGTTPGPVRVKPWSALLSSMTTETGPLARMLPALLIVALLACMLVPLSTLLVDVLLSLSLSAAVLLLVASMTVRRSADFLGFPRLLLLTTLFRLALNVQTTRLILADRFAGEVIAAFSSLVVREELIVGVVMFGIITAVQFLVVTRGSERVAEVAARFALDGLPGHQAAIDADLRSGAISIREAERRRARLVERSNFYGAMDGAVRFVKGDAIAGISITVINILGGFVIGLRDKMPVREIVDTYGKLAIGDGLMAQIPAVLVSLAAGVLVARVDREGRPESRTSSPWFEPSAVFVPVLLLSALAFVPGMPRAAFIVTALGLLCAGLWIAYQRARERSGADPRGAGPRVHVLFMGSAPVPSDARDRLATVHHMCQQALNIPLPPFETARAPSRELASAGVQVLFEQRILADYPELDTADEDELWNAIYRAVANNACAFIDLHDVERWVEDVARERSAIARRALEIVQLEDLLELVHGFLRDRLPVPPMEALLSTVVEQRLFRDERARPRWLGLARAHLVAYWLRPALAQYTSQRRAGPTRWIRPLPDAEEELVASVVRGEGGVRLGLTTRERAAWRVALLGEAPADSKHAANVIVVTRSVEAREAFALLLRDARRALVLCLPELVNADISMPEHVRWVAAPEEL